MTAVNVTVDSVNTPKLIANEFDALPTQKKKEPLLEELDAQLKSTGTRQDVPLEYIGFSFKTPYSRANLSEYVKDSASGLEPYTICGNAEEKFFVCKADDGCRVMDACKPLEHVCAANLDSAKIPA